jgi:chromosome segregation ATPase
MYMYTVDGRMVNLLRSGASQDPYSEFEKDSINELAYTTVVEHFDAGPYFAILAEIGKDVEQTYKPRTDANDALKDLVINTPKFEERVTSLLDTLNQTSSQNSDDSDDEKRQKIESKAKMINEIKPAVDVITQGLVRADDPLNVFISIINSNMARLAALQNFINRARARMQSFLDAIRARQAQILEAKRKELPDPQIPPIEIPPDAILNMTTANQIQGSVTHMLNVYRGLQGQYNRLKEQYNDVKSRIDKMKARLEQA